MEERQSLQQECMEWESRLMDVKHLVLDGLGKDPSLYSVEVNDDYGEPWETNVVVKKKSELNDIANDRQQISTIPPMNGIIEHCFNQIIMNTREVGFLNNGEKEAIKEDHEEEASCQHPEIVIKEEILEIQSPSYI